METIGFFFFSFTTLFAVAAPMGNPPLLVALAVQFVLNGVSNTRIGFAG